MTAMRSFMGVRIAFSIDGGIDHRRNAEGRGRPLPHDRHLPGDEAEEGDHRGPMEEAEHVREGEEPCPLSPALKRVSPQRGGVEEDLPASAPAYIGEPTRQRFALSAQ